MNTQKHRHTPGPWHFSPGHDPHNQAHIYGEDGKTLAITYSDEGSANAQLIASAPDMLEALRELTAKAWRSFDFRNTPEGARNADLLKKAEDAIAKAEGGAQ